LLAPHRVHQRGRPSRKLPQFCAAAQPNPFGIVCLALSASQQQEGPVMNSIIYLVGLVVVVMAVLSFVGLH
jgi:hypothetical protein